MRRSQAKIRKINIDPIYKNKVVTKLINRSMKDGKKSVAQKQIYACFDLIKTKFNEDPLKVLQTALDNIRPEMEVRPRRIGGAVYQVPTMVRPIRKESLSVRWLIAGARSKPNKEFHTFGEKLAQELIEASKGEGYSVRKKQETEKMAEANKAFSHFKW